MQLVGATGEGLHHGVGDLVEERSEQAADRAARELEAHRELDLAGVLGQRREAPRRLEVPERAFDQPHVDGARRPVLVQRGEGVADSAQPRGERRALWRSRIVDPRLDAPGQEARVRGNVVDQPVHRRGAVLYDRRAADFLHKLEFFMSIVDNRKASHDYFIEERYEAGIALEGWEVKAIRAGRAQIGEAYVMVRGAELYLIGAHISPLPTVSTHFIPNPTRTRKLLMHGEEIRRLIGKVEQRGYSLVPLNLHYAKGRIKLDLALAKGKLQHDKRADKREKDWNREKQRLLRSSR